MRRSSFARNSDALFTNESGKVGENEMGGEFLIDDDLMSFNDYLKDAIRFDGKKVTDDMNIYRYLPKDRFLDMIENKHLVLPHISLWQDPFEGFLFKSDKVTETLRKMYAGFYGQCWTFGKHEMDWRWRSYCPNGDGVRIKTTVGKVRSIIDRLFDYHGSRAYATTGAIIYVNDNWKMLTANGPLDLPMPRPDIKKRGDAVKWLFVKREFFRQENEFRVLCHIGHAGLRELSAEKDMFERKDGLLKCKVPHGFNSIIDEVLLDPRMSVADVDRIKCRLVQAEFGATILQSSIYQWPNV